MNYRKYYTDTLFDVIGRQLHRQDGIPLKAVHQCEKSMHIHLPEALRTYYAVAGKLLMNREHNVLYDPSELVVMDGMLIFMEENQRVAFWATKVGSCAADPTVYQGMNIKPIKWYSEKMRVSHFIIKMWKWQKMISRNKLGIGAAEMPRWQTGKTGDSGSAE